MIISDFLLDTHLVSVYKNMGLDFRHTGLPRGHVQKVKLGTGTVTAAAGNKLYITAIMVIGSSDSDFTIDGSASFSFPGGSTLGLPYPVECDSFAASEAATSTVYIETSAL